MPMLPELPLSRGELARYRVAMRKRAQAGQVGSHLLRRQGQSLEFHDHAAYTPGDDFRHIDWQASVRHGDEHDLLVRQFRAEENLNLVISIDSRSSMTYPAPASKLCIACWLAFATTVIATSSGDRVHLHRLFEPSGPALTLRGSRSEPRAWSFLQDLADEPSAADSRPTLAAIARLLPPASVWLIITDLYFDDHDGTLARAMTRAQRGLCWVLLLELDSWPCERAILGQGARKIIGPGVADDEIRLDVNPSSLQAVDDAITAHKARLLDPVPRRGLSRLHWSWPATPQPDPATFFEHMLTTDEHLQRLFRRQR
jgi:uncharacterized protein (DUF58 family)